MPTYEYRCTSCDHTFDRVQRMSDDPVANCPQCDSRTERLVSGGAGFLFKGDGFYITDSRSDSYKKKAANETGSSDSSSAKKSESPSSSGPSSSGDSSSSDSSSSDSSSSDSSSSDSSSSDSKSSDSKSSTAAPGPAKGDG